ncbi:MAG: hypothetical protein M3Y50_07945 [Acidobacteriota bacterium]|nr:hypothetical protein [Acidobacteriota bacterium]
MPSPSSTRFNVTSCLSLTLCVVLSCPAHAQSKPAAGHPASPTLPAMPATQAAVPVVPSQPESRHAQIVYTNGMLSVVADNSSLNQILRQISHETGVKITGGVADERVFGQYGPSAPADILATLLSGTGSNMLLLHRDAGTPAELILTPRLGGPTPPNPNASVFDDAPEPAEQSKSAEPVNSASPSSSPHHGSFVEVTPATASQPPSDPGQQPQSPNGVKTPQEIFDQLQRLRQQQQAPNQ